MFIFNDYVDDHGINVIRDWLKSLSPKARAKVNTRISALEALPRNQWADFTGALVGSGWDGIYEIRIRYDNIQLRPLFAYGPGREEATLLMGAEERGGEIEPRSAASTCQTRAARVRQGTNTVKHDYN